MSHARIDFKLQLTIASVFADKQKLRYSSISRKSHETYWTKSERDCSKPRY